MDQRKIIYLREVAEMLDVTVEYARSLAVAGKIPCFRYTKRGKWRAFKEDVDNFLANSRSSPKAGQVSV